MHNTAVIILAAGNASRMGSPKQALPYAGTTLLQHVVREAVKAAGEQVYVVTGAHEHIICDLLAAEKVHVVKNDRWEEGMGTSISTGIAALPQQIESVILAVADQPYISADLLQQLVTTANTSGKGIVASMYDGTAGTPALFNRNYFDALLALEGHGGAKKIIQQYKTDAAHVDFPAGRIDIDTQEDYLAIVTS